MGAGLQFDGFCARDHHLVSLAVAVAIGLSFGLGLLLRVDDSGGPADPVCPPLQGDQQVRYDRVYRTRGLMNTRCLVLCGDGTYGFLTREHVATFIHERGMWEASGRDRVRLQRAGLAEPDEVSLEGRVLLTAGQFEAEWRDAQHFRFHPEMSVRNRGRRMPVVDRPRR